MEHKTVPTNLDERTQILWQEVFSLRQQLAKLAKAGWIQKQELEALFYENYALRLRIQELEEEIGKGLDSSQPPF